MAPKSARSTKKGASAFVEALRRLAESKGKIRYDALEALSGADARAVEAFRSEWQAIPAERRRAVAKMMLESAEESLQTDFASLFHVMLDDPEESVRAAAVEGLWSEESPTYGKRLLKIYADDPSAVVRAAAASGLGNYLYEAEMEEIAIPPGEQITKVLLAHFNNPDEELEVRRRSLEAVAWSSDERVHGAIQAAYDDEDRDMRASAIFAMGRSADKAWIPTVVRELRNQEPALRYEAATAAGELAAQDAMPYLVKMVDDPDGQVREAVVWALGEIGGNEARRILERIVAEGPESLAEAAEEALAEIEIFSDLESFSMFDFETATLEDLETTDDEDDDPPRRARAN
jgi:HEAT repeat protein